MEQSHFKCEENSNVEVVEFPLVCETCLGPNPFVRMQKFPTGGSCHISGRPYTVFRWKAGSEARYKKTVICHEVAKAKNVCQVCMLDLDYNLPVQIRDKAFNISNEDPPMSDVGKEFSLSHAGDIGAVETSFHTLPASDLLTKLVRTEPYYKRNHARVCSFFVKGSCNRGAECPYRHEMPTNSSLSKQNYHDRYYGHKDPVAEKMLARSSNIPNLVQPMDASISTLFIGNITPEIRKDDLHVAFKTFGEIQEIEFLYERNCAFITFCTRQAAEKAAHNINKRLIIKGLTLKVRWGKSSAKHISAEKVLTHHIDPKLRRNLDFKEQSTLYKAQGIDELYGAVDPRQFGSSLY
jgi:pre-mRNA-splicing factor RBM22/SLT11